MLNRLRSRIEAALYPVFGGHEEYQYLNLLRDVLKNGQGKGIFSENGKTIGTVLGNQYKEINKDEKGLSSVVGRTLRFSLENGVIPIYTTKVVHWQGAFKEMLWFLTDKGDVAALHQQGCKVWNSWAYKDYKRRNPTSQMTYEAFVSQYLAHVDREYFINVPYTDMTGWEVTTEKQGSSFHYSQVINQTQWAIDEIKKNPVRKSYVVSAWNPARLYAMAKQVGNESVEIAACHNFHQVVVNGDCLSLIVNIRSNDLFLGNGYNVCQYGLLAHMYAKCTGFKAHELIVQIGDAHIYNDQVEAVKMQLQNRPKPFPKLAIADNGQQYLTDFKYEDFKVIGYESEAAIPAPLSVIGGF